MKREKEFKHLNRAELVEIIYQLQIDNQRLNNEKAEIQKKLDSKELKISEAGSIAEATVSISDIFIKAQEVADHYLSEIKRNNAELEQQCEAKLSQAQFQAEVILRDAEYRARQVTESAEKESARKLEEAEKESARKWQNANEKIMQLIKSHDALKDFLQE